MTKILLLDSNSLINRAFYALPPMQTKDGLFTNAIYGYLSMLNKLINEENPTHICAVFDCHAKTFRHIKYSEYKAGRKPMPEELVMQVPVLQDLLTKMGIKILFKEGIEADDIIGTLSKRFHEETIIVSGDRDVLQLVDDTTTVFHTKRGVTDIKKYTPELLREEGFTPEQIIEYKALAGDSSDNIPGCNGIGDKTAKDLLAKYGSVEGIYRNIDGIKGKLREKLENDRSNVYLSKDLATIETSADIPCALDDISFDPVLPDEAKETMTKLEFKNLIARFNYKDEHIVPSVRPEIKYDRIEISSCEEGEKAISNIPKGAVVSIDYGRDVFITYEKTTIKIPICEGLFGDGLSEDDALQLIKKLYGKEYKKVFFDAKKEMYKLSERGVEIMPPYDDVLLQAYLINNTKVIKDVASLLTDYGFKGENLSEDVMELNAILSEKIQEKNLSDLYFNVELPLIRCLFDMERVGLTVDLNVLNELNEQLSAEIATLVETIYDLAGEKDFNINSNKQLADILFGKLGLKASKKNKTGFSVSADVLEELEHPIVDALLRYRQLAKLKSTYIDGMKQVVNKATGRVHTDFKQCLTTTGRLSSNEPNLQNIPVRTAEGREIRKMFVAKDGNVLISADYSQIELRLLAHFSQEPNLIEAYKNGRDVHALTASKIFKTPLEEVTSSMRRSAKAVNFGIIYGISGFGLAKNAGVSQKQAKAFIEEYFATYPKVREYMDQNVALAKQQGYLTSLAGRLRYFPELTSPQYTIRAFGERAAMNFPLQGSASDIIKIAMLRVYNALKEGNFKSKLILQVHDELIVEAPEEEREKVIELLRENMKNAVELTIPLDVGVAYGKNWYDAK